MNPLTGWLSQDPLAAACGLFGLACLTGWPLLRTRGEMLSAQAGAGLGFGVNHALLGEGTGAIVSLLVALLTVAALALAYRPQLRPLYLSITAGVVGGNLLAWQGASLAPALLALGLLVSAHLQADPARLRLLGLLAAACGSVLAFVEGSLPQFTGNVLAIGLGLAHSGSGRHEPPMGGPHPAV